jgi:hypothetical protein
MPWKSNVSFVWPGACGRLHEAAAAAAAGARLDAADEDDPELEGFESALHATRQSTRAAAAAAIRADRIRRSYGSTGIQMVHAPSPCNRRSS